MARNSVRETLRDAPRVKELLALSGRCHTVEDFAAVGLVLDVACDQLSEHSEYWCRVMAGLPTTAPVLQVGEWAYNPIANQNQRIVEVWWDRPFAGLVGGWRYSQPGYSTLHPNRIPVDTAPYVEYVRLEGQTHVWTEAK